MSTELIQYLLEHEHDDPIKILLNRKTIAGYPPEFVANQLNCRKRAKEKLPTWYANLAVTYPPKQNLEQCSSEITAKVKCNFIQSIAQQKSTLIDLTGGFGVDSFFFSKIFEKVVHVEPNENLCRLAKENHAQLRANNIEHVNQTAEKFLEYWSDQADWVFIDPSRKTEGKKLVKLSDCEPDVTQLLPSLWAKTNQILIKAAPLLDIKEGLRQLANTAHVLVVSVSNDCKEALFHLQKDFVGEPEVHCINLQSNSEQLFAFRIGEEAVAQSNFKEPQAFLYEPNASILKAGAFKKIGAAFGLFKLAANTHLYTSENKVEHFPGRVFRALGEITAQAQLLPDGKANVISRNHPLSPEDIKKKYHLRDGGERYVMACSTEKKKYLLIAERMQ